MSRPSPVRTILLTALIGMGALIGGSAPAAAFTPAEAKAPMTAMLVRSDAKDCGTDCPEWLGLTGKIGFKTPGRLNAALARLGSRRVPVLLDSPGGESDAGLALGRIIRAHRLDVVVAGTQLTNCEPIDRACLDRLRKGVHPGSVSTDVAACASACVFMLAGGIERSVPPRSFVGVHQTKMVQTFRRVINTFRVMKRMVGGRAIEVSRTLIASRALPAKVVVSAAPEKLYSEFDRFLIGMGIDESIMPLMRATPPTGIHWMTPAELVSTRIETDTIDAQTLLAREAEGEVLARLPAVTPVISALTLDDGRRSIGSATWRIDATAPNAPKLVVDVAIPERQLKGTLTLARATDPATAGAYTGRVRFASASDADPPISDMQPPQFCDPQTCVMPMTPDASFVGNRYGSYAFDIPALWGETLLSSLRSRDWLDLPVRTADGWGKVTVPLTGAGSTVIAAWEQLCCGHPMASQPPRPISNPPLPALPMGPKRTTASPGAPVAMPMSRPVDGRFSFSLTPRALRAIPVTGAGTVSWIPAASGAVIASLASDKLGFRMSVEAQSGRSADATLEFNFVTTSDRFGPVASMAIPPIWTQDAHIAISAESIDRFTYGGGYRVSLRLPGEEHASSSIEIQMTDVAGRRLTLMLPIEAPLRDMFQAARERHAAGAG